ncbi:MAG: 2Fe-2S iron-sulfur cluster-binding protein [Verrucomicrobiia bacterium]|jgi:ferredoxin
MWAKITVLPENKSAEFKAGEFILDASDLAGVTLDSGCLNCSCGSCAVEIVSGEENLEPMTDKEKEILVKRGKEPGKFRLACCVRILKGEVIIRSNY